MKYCILMLLAVLLLPAQAKAAACYPPLEQEAEQLVRLHSQLMVITLSCRTTSDGTPLPPAYQKFTKTYLQNIKDAERALINWHRKNNGGNGISRLDRLRTEFSNEYSRTLALLTPARYCEAYRNYVAQAANFDRLELGRTLLAMRDDYRGRIPPCQPIRQASAAK